MEEFLSALDGFLDRQATPKDLNYLRFLEIFCRSVGAGVGHLLKINDAGRLESVISFGFREDFDKEFNRAHKAGSETGPLDDALRQKKVIAVVEITPELDIPEWFLKIMRGNEFRSLVAVPLIGQVGPVGVLCAYYRDVCLFDQGTLDRLMVLGRMVGAAIEKSGAAELKDAQDARTKISDHYLAALTQKSFNKLQLFALLNKAIKQAFEPISSVCGPVKRTQEGLILTLVAGNGIPNSAISHKFALPQFLERKLTSGQWPKNFTSATREDWGELGRVVDGAAFKVIAHPLLWQGKVQGGVIAWRPETASFEKLDEMLLIRLATITALALNVS